MTNHELHFPADFVWGVATASYQIEGAANEDGRGASVWDTFSHTPGKVANGDTGDVACDHYHRWRDDIALMKSLNLSAYRFSIAWSRVLPAGRGQINEKGLDFYDRLVDGLLAEGLTPYATLYHWDLPQALQDEGGGWLRRSIIDDYAVYVDTVSRALGDRVKRWITFNEPWVFAWLGYFEGRHAPGIVTNDAALPLAVSHHSLVAHGEAVPILRANSKDAQVGITLNVTHVDPATPTPHDLAAAARYDGFINRWYLDPLFKGAYPADMVDLYGASMPLIQPGDMKKIAAPLDFLGLNYYFRTVVADVSEHDGLRVREVIVPDVERTAMGWEIYPEGLYEWLKRAHEEYHAPAVYITENGAAFDDTVAPDGQVHDARRAAYLRDHFAAASRALDEGIPLKGYFVWSLMDNFEWAEGYTKRFGVTYTDYATQQRTIKDSGHFLAQIAKR